MKPGRNGTIPSDAAEPVEGKRTINKGYSGLRYDFAVVDSLKEEIDGFRPSSKRLAQSLHEKLIVEWTYNSNAIEGNALTMSETKVVLEGFTIGGKTMAEHLETINHRDTILFIEDLVPNKEAISEWNIKNIQSLILKGIDKQKAGKYRVENVLVCGANIFHLNIMKL